MEPILEALVEKKLNHKDRLCLISDSFALARAGHMRWKAAFRIASNLTCEMDFTVWTKLHSELESFRQLLLERCLPSDECGSEPITPFEETLNSFIVSLATPPFKRLGNLTF